MKFSRRKLGDTPWNELLSVIIASWPTVTPLEKIPYQGNKKVRFGARRALHFAVINGLIAAGSCLMAVAIGELGLRSVVRRPLPPFSVVDPASFSAVSNREVSYAGIVVDGKKITVGDLFGYYRLDPVLGYTTKENTISVNGWWQSNNIGARSRRDTRPEIPTGKTRLLIFGESFGEAARLPHEEAWSSLLETLDRRVEVVNLAVSGYSMAQAYLRYLSVRNHLEYNNVIMMFVPEVDLWRDINTLRDLNTEWGWHNPFVQPRFVIENGDLKLVPSPRADPLDVFQDNREMLSERLRNHLRRYDRFYFRSLYESPPLVGRLWIYKMYASIYGNNAKEALLRGLMRPDSEAMQVSHKIFSAMQEQAGRNQAQFALIVLPYVRGFHTDPQAWQAMIDFVCAGIRICIDLAPSLRMIPFPEVDAGYDGGHYGPRMNRRIAETVFSEFLRHGFLSNGGAVASLSRN